jgi:type III pantothenate kinase
LTGQVLIDLGNSRWKVAKASRGVVGEVRQGLYVAMDAYSEALAELSGEGSVVMAASVVDTTTSERFLSLARDITGSSVRRVLSSDAVPGVRSGYRDPAQLGVDRLLAMVAGHSLTSGPFCVVDAGSAVTIDFVDAAGQHLGGLILPGHRLARECLLARTSIPREAEVEPGARLGRDTPTALALGSLYAVAGIVERFVVGSESLFPQGGVTLFLGGGDAMMLESLMPVPCERVEHLVLSGLGVLAAAEAS